MSKSSNKFLKTLLVIGTAASAVYLFNKHVSDSATAKNKLFVKKDSYYHWKHGDVYYQTSGSGKPLLLIHDYSHCGSSYEWDKLVDSLSAHYTVYTVDLLGCGRSDKPQITYTNYLYVQLINDFILNVIGDKTSLISSGFSSSIAIMTSAYDSSSIDKLILINPSDINQMNTVCTQSDKIFSKILQLPFIGTFVYNILTTRTKIEKQLTESFLYNPFNITTDMIDTFYEAAHRGSGNGKYVLSSYVEKYMNANLIHGLKNLTQDILILGGEQESHIHNIIEQYQEYNSHIDSVLVEMTKRIPHYEKAEDVTDKLLLFLEQ